MTGWRAKVRNLLSDDDDARAITQASAKTAIVAKTPSGPRRRAGFGGFGNSGREGAVTADNLAERAAIVEEGAAVPTEWAVALAFLEIRSAPDGVSTEALRAAIDAACRFVDQWAAKAAALGWTGREVFGSNEAAILLAGADVLAVTAGEISLRRGEWIVGLRRPPSITPR
ncbi:MAG TPA: hypothetical protein VGS12_07215 [Caulobacteraceae bacterium]|nr:hypothetical protein [Caulobacteraceae bacterium]